MTSDAVIAAALGPSIVPRSVLLAFLVAALVAVLLAHRRISRDLRDTDIEIRALELLDEELELLRDTPPAETRSITLRVGATGADDSVEERRRVDASPSRPIAYQYFQIGSTGDRAAFDRDFAVVRFSITTEHDSVADLVVSEPRDGHRRVLLLFRPPLTSPADWTLECRVPGMWDPLRANGVDSYDYALAVTPLTALSIAFIAGESVAVRQSADDSLALTNRSDPATPGTTTFSGRRVPAGSAFRFELRSRTATE